MRCEQSYCMYWQDNACTEPEDVYINFDRRCIKFRPVKPRQTLSYREMPSLEQLLEAMDSLEDPQMKKDRLRHLLLAFADELRSPGP